MVLVSISRVWLGDNPPTHCDDDGEPLELWSKSPPDREVYRGGLWQCPKCKRYYAWAVQELNKNFECNKPDCNWFENCKKFGCGTPLKNVQSSASLPSSDETAEVDG